MLVVRPLGGQLLGEVSMFLLQAMELDLNDLQTFQFFAEVIMAAIACLLFVLLGCIGLLCCFVVFEFL